MHKSKLHDVFGKDFKEDKSEDKVKEQEKKDEEANVEAQKEPGAQPQDQNVAADPSRVRVDNLYNCPDCQGKGLLNHEQPNATVCTKCAGTGKV